VYLAKGPSAMHPSGPFPSPPKPDSGSKIVALEKEPASRASSQYGCAPEYLHSVRRRYSWACVNLVNSLPSTGNEFGELGDEDLQPVEREEPALQTKETCQ
jgi:hypothetical protein